MKLLGILVVVGVALYLGVIFAFPAYTHRYRLTIEIDTPEGVRSGSSVIEVTRNDVRLSSFGGARYTFHVRGDAVFVDLGAGRNVIALLAMGTHGQGIDQMISLQIEAYGHYKWDERAWNGKAKMQGPVELKPPLIPTLITMPDVSDPRSAQVIYANDLQEIKDGSNAPRDTPRVTIDRFSEKLGPGVRFRRAVLETTSDDVTRGIEQKIPWISRMKAEGLGARIDGEPGKFRLNVPVLTRG